jgi:GNAT superfamily N-acetyltransferase
MADLDIRPLTADLWDALVALFTERSDMPTCSLCWCMFWRWRAKDFASSTVAGNRAALRALVEDDPAPGVVAIEDGQVVGWCSVGPRGDYERLDHSRTIPRLDDRPTWAIVCFVVGRSARGRGVARALLDGAVDYAAENAAPAIEAYPAAPPEGERIPTSSAYTGTLGMFVDAGFRVVSETGSRTGGVPRVIVRRDLD